MERCGQCSWIDPAPGDSEQDSAARMFRHMETHGEPAFVTLERAQRQLREAKRRYGFAMDSGRES